MHRIALWRVVQGWYWLALGAWVGALVVLAIVAAAVFGTVSDFLMAIGSTPAETVSRVFSPTELSGLIVGQVIDELRVMQWVGASVVIGCVVLQSVLLSNWLPMGGMPQWMNTLRIILLVSVVMILAVDNFHVSPRARQWQAAMHAQNDNMVVDTQAVREAFDRYHYLSVQLVKMRY